MRFKVYKGQNGDWYWRLVADNGKIIADSAEGYRNKADLEHAIMIIKAYAPQAPVDGG